MNKCVINKTWTCLTISWFGVFLPHFSSTSERKFLMVLGGYCSKVRSGPVSRPLGLPSLARAKLSYPSFKRLHTSSEPGWINWAYANSVPCAGSQPVCQGTLQNSQEKILLFLDMGQNLSKRLSGIIPTLLQVSGFRIWALRFSYCRSSNTFSSDFTLLTHHLTLSISRIWVAQDAVIPAGAVVRRRHICVHHWGKIVQGGAHHLFWGDGETTCGTWDEAPFWKKKKSLEGIQKWWKWSTWDR